MPKANKKLTVALVCGGQSAEHEVSVESARNVYAALNKAKYNIVIIGLAKNGDWLSLTPAELAQAKQVAGRNFALPFCRGGQFYFKIKNLNKKIDVVFPLVHGPMGEDGTLQGLFKIFNVPFVGAGVLGSAVGMDKDIAKKLLVAAGLPVAKFLTYNKQQIKTINFNKIKQALGLPFFIKPANMGSSVGIAKINKPAEFSQAVKHAFSFDDKIILEENIKGREIECAVLGNNNPKASVLGEIKTKYSFYSYEAKYLDEAGAELIIPANLPKNLTKKIQNLALQVFAVLNCRGMGRVDFFVKPNQEIIINEINTIPGFTKISMYPKLWEASGLPYGRLIDKLIALAS